MEMLSNILQQLPVTLKSLYIDIPTDPKFASCLVNFRNLVNLGMIAKAKDKFKLYITNDTFKPLKNLPIRNITLCSKTMTKVDAMAFSWFSKLESLDMSNSSGMDVNELSDAWLGLKNTSLKSLNLRRFKMKTGPRQVHLTRFFRNFNFDNLTELLLDDTGIAGASVWRFSKQTTNLQTLSLSINFLNHSQMNKLLTNIRNLTNLTNLDMSNQLPRNTEADRTVKIDVDLPSNLENIDLSQTLVWPSYSHHDLVLNLRQSNTLKWFKLTNNFVDQIATPFIHTPNPNVPIDINLNFNRLTSLAFLKDSAVRGLKIRELYLTGNMLGRTMDETIFENFYHLEKLDLGSNGIKQLTGKVFSNQKNLKLLKLAANCLWLIDFEFTHMSNLTALNLRGNSLTHLNTETRDRIDRLKRISPKFVIDLQRNPLECSCSNLPFIQWAYEHKTTFVTFKNITCVYNDKVVKFVNIKKIVRNLNFECSMNLAVKLSTGLLALVIVITGLSVFLYSHRWDVRFFFIKFAAKRNVYIERVEYQSLYEYDAFVSYHNNDVDWVRDELYKNLDEEGGEHNLVDNQARFKLCIHARDFTPGIPIEDNIVRAIENSRKTILVLSKSFLTSEWCEFELQMARMESFDKGRNLIIVVMLEPLKIEHMSKSLRLLIRRNTYIEWFEDPENKTNFWEKLREALGSDPDVEI